MFCELEPKKRSRAGFTLIELMVAVTIVAVLAVIGTIAFGRLSKRARTNETTAFFATVDAAQTSYFNMYGQYCATSGMGPWNWDPSMAGLHGRASDWVTQDPAWSACGIRLPSSTWFQYIVVAGNETTSCANPPNALHSDGSDHAVPACVAILAASGGANPPGLYWYYTVARGDQDDDSAATSPNVYSYFGSSSEMMGQKWSIPGLELE